jgi:transcriptional regulator with XRE-family HTH domain
VRTFRSRPADLGRQRAREIRLRFGREIRTARLAAGLTQRQLGELARIRQEYVSAIERAVRSPSLDVASRLAAAIGHELGLRLYPADGVPLRDTGQLRLIEAVVKASDAATWHARTEVPVSATDRRAADLVLSSAVEVVHVEAERLITDLQAQVRSASLKRDALATRHDRPVRLILAVPDTRPMRQLLREHAAFMGRTFPISSRAIWRALRTGRPIRGDGLLFVRLARLSDSTRRPANDVLEPLSLGRSTHGA